MEVSRLRLGWFSSARDKAARDLLLEVHKRIKDGFIKAEIGFVFLTKTRNESEEAKRFYSLCDTLGLKVLSLSSRGFLPKLRKEDPSLWRRAYHEKVKEILQAEKMDLGVLSGYMLIVDRGFLEDFPLINLHPALPGGPKGSWEEVIWTLIEKGEERSGAMVHLVTEELDSGPALSYFVLELRGGGFDPLWEKVGKVPLKDLKTDPWAQRLFWAIRQEEQKREPPLLVLTLRGISLGEVDLKEAYPLDLTEEVENYIQRQRA